MTNSLPPDPQPSRRDPLGFDEFIGIFLAFSVIGGILFWSLGREGQGFNLGGLLDPTSTPSATPTPTATPTASPSPVEGVLTPSPTPNQPTPTTVPAPEPAQPNVVPVPFAVRPPATPTPSPTPTTAEPEGFSDVETNYWAYPFITALVQRDIISGFPDGTFRPDAPVTRAEYASMLQKAFDKPAKQQAVSYKDVAGDFWATDAIQEVSRNGFLAGYPKNIFQPTQQIPRVQALVALASGLELPRSTAPTQVLQTYQDAAQIPKYATGAVASATQAGLAVSHPRPNVLEPNEKATRADAAAFIYQALVASGKAEKISSQYLTQP
ncbi:S-layer homology domain-containing protein [Trichocoleus sp. FACHB-262]|uniref:S-layer homology domain-containing protein n=1 Tax=Trichocoleus sp. FACHB-262 TaxID=2692869 RepID=UPI001689F823|nr:S-layer homology domain-containing protein [Trichocoleus sp. FACHB-262]MBD2122564.1 S-layer homology domain-containing protein [Trichocoleus sp. FACHB-262]